jgi:hypothetical protein
MTRSGRTRHANSKIVDRNVLPIPDPPFTGVANRDARGQGATQKPLCGSGLGLVRRAGLPSQSYR